MTEIMRLPPCKPIPCGADFRYDLHKPSNGYKKKSKHIRIVPAFTIQALQKNTQVIKPPKCDVFKENKPPKRNPFLVLYKRGDLPVAIEFCQVGKKLLWKIPIEKLDYVYYLPLFLYGLCEGEYPYTFIVERGILDLIRKGSHKILSCVPYMVTPLKAAYSTKKVSAIMSANRCLVIMVSKCAKVGEALVPYYKQLLPVLALFLRRPRITNIDEVIVHNEDVWYSIEDTLCALERHGGPNAFLNIKYYVPDYESCYLN